MGARVARVPYALRACARCDACLEQTPGGLPLAECLSVRGVLSVVCHELGVPACVRVVLGAWLLASCACYPQVFTRRPSM